MSLVAQRVQLGPFFSGGTLQGAAKLYHYAAGTSTLKNLWTDRGMTTTVAQPLVADSNGVFNFFADGLYKFIVCGPNSTGPSVDVLYTLDNWQLLDPQSDILWSEGAAIASASSIALGSEVWNHITGSTNIDAITGAIPFAWLVFDGNLTLNYSANLLTPGAVSLTVHSRDVVFLLNEGGGVWRVAGGQHGTIGTQDGRTSTIATPLSVTATTTGAPAAGIGVGIKYQAQSADETPSDFGQLGFAATDVTANSEDTYLSVWLRIAGNALTEVYRWIATGAFKTIFSSSHTADRTYTLVDRNVRIGAGDVFAGPISCGPGSTVSHNGTASVGTTSLSGLQLYTDLTVTGTITVPAGGKRLILWASNSITLTSTGAINGQGGGGDAGAGSNGGTATNGGNGTDQAGGGGGLDTGHAVASGYGGTAQLFGDVLQAGTGRATSGNSANATSLSGNTLQFLHPYLAFLAMGGAGGGGGASTTGLAGGAGGATIILIAPTITLASGSTISSAGANGGSNNGGFMAGGGGGGAGNIYIFTQNYTDSGCTFTTSGGTGGLGSTGTVCGGNGANGWKQIYILGS